MIPLLGILIEGSVTLSTFSLQTYFEPPLKALQCLQLSLHVCKLSTLNPLNGPFPTSNTYACNTAQPIMPFHNYNTWLWSHTCIRETSLSWRIGNPASTPNSQTMRKCRPTNPPSPTHQENVLKFCPVGTGLLLCYTNSTPQHPHLLEMLSRQGMLLYIFWECPPTQTFWGMVRD